MKDTNKEQKILESIKEIDYFKEILKKKKQKKYKKADGKMLQSDLAKIVAIGVAFFWVLGHLSAIPIYFIAVKGFKYGIDAAMSIFFTGSIPVIIITKLLLKLSEILSDESKELQNSTKIFDKKIVELDRAKELLDQTLIREGIETSVLEERYSLLIDEKKLLLESKEVNEDELQKKYRCLKDYKRRITAVKEALQEIKQKQYIEEIHQECQKIIQTDAMALNYSQAKEYVIKRGN